MAFLLITGLVSVSFWHTLCQSVLYCACLSVQVEFKLSSQCICCICLSSLVHFSSLQPLSCPSIHSTLFPSISPTPSFHSPSYHKQVCYISQCPSAQDRIVPVQNNPGSVTYILDQLNPGTTYNIRVTASTRAGEGPPAIVTNRTIFEG